jgi:hypothetical protein
VGLLQQMLTGQRAFAPLNILKQIDAQEQAIREIDRQLDHWTSCPDRVFHPVYCFSDHLPGARFTETGLLFQP